MFTSQLCHQIRHVIYYLKSQEHLNKFLSGILKGNTYFTIDTNSINFGVGAHTDTLLVSYTYIHKIWLTFNCLSICSFSFFSTAHLSWSSFIFLELTTSWLGDVLSDNMLSLLACKLKKQIVKYPYSDFHNKLIF